MANITNDINPSLNKLASPAVKRKVSNLANELETLIDERREVVNEEGEKKVELKEALKPLYFKFNTNARTASEVKHTFDVGPLQVNFTNAYFIGDTQHLQTLVKLLGNGHPLVDEIKETTKITVDVTDLTPEQATALTKAITTEAINYDIRPQVDRVQSVTPEFHNLRHVYLTPEDNLQLDEELPLTIQVTPITDIKG